MANFQWNVSRSKFVAKMKDGLVDANCVVYSSPPPSEMQAMQAKLTRA